jgi:hypothetical protein
LKVVREGDETLQASYCSFAEKFLAKVAEAEDAGRPIKSVVVKSAFKTAIEKEVALKTWFEGDRWRGVNLAHSRLLRKLREARSWEAISKTVLKAKTPAPSRESEQPTSDENESSPRNFRRAPRRRSNNTRKESAGKSKGRFGHRLKSGGRRGSNNNTRSRSNSTQDGKVTGKRAGHGGTDREEKRRTWQGYDNRGESWHDDHSMFECYKKPCNAPFCQRCARHGHTADTCRVPDSVDGLNDRGYFQERRPGKAGPKKPPARINSTGKRRQDDDSEDDCASSGSTEHRGDKRRNCL